jgi:hypothetical protein
MLCQDFAEFAGLESVVVAHAKKPPTRGGFFAGFKAVVLRPSPIWDGYLRTGQSAFTMLAALAVPMPDVKSHPTPAS